MTESNNNIIPSRGGTTNFLADIANEIGVELVNNPQLKLLMVKHTKKVIQKAEEYGQYLRTEWQKAKEAGLTQHDENKDEEEWYWWTAYSKDWTWGEGVYFANEESLGVQFYIKGKPKPDPLSYLCSMVWGSVGENYNGLELLDYQVLLLTIIHDAQNWQAGRKTIYFNPLHEKTLSDRLSRTVWHHLANKIDSYNFRDVKDTIKTALLASKTSLRQENKALNFDEDINTSKPEKKRPWVKKVCIGIAGLVAFLGSLIGVINYSTNVLSGPELKICFALTGSQEISIVANMGKPIDLLNLGLIYRNNGNKTAHDTKLRLIYSDDLRISSSNEFSKQDLSNGSTRKRTIINIGDIHPDKEGDAIDSKLEIFLHIGSISIVEIGLLAPPFNLGVDSYYPSDKIATFEINSQMLAENYPSKPQKLYIQIGTPKAFKDYSGLLFNIVDHNLVEYRR